MCPANEGPGSRTRCRHLAALSSHESVLWPAGPVCTPSIAAIRGRLVDDGPALADPDVVEGGGTGQAWAIQAGRAMEHVDVPDITTTRTDR